MSGIEIALIVLVVLWAIIFLIIGVVLVMIFLAVKRVINKANNILDKTEAVASKVDLPSKVVMASIVAFMARTSMGPITKFIANTILKKRR